MKKQFGSFLCGIFLLAFCQQVVAQGTPDYGGGIKIPLDSSGQKYIRFITWHQVWVRYNENNPGSTINGTQESSQVDMSLRRSRFLAYSQVNSKFLVLLHFGINNANQVSGGAAGQGASGSDGKKPQLFIHDAFVEHKVYKDALSIGGGLHYWQGPSRLASASTLNFLGIDSPVFSWTNIDANDQFARQYGIYAKGKLLKGKRHDYRIALNFPFAFSKGSSLSALDTVSAKNGRTNSSYRAGGQPSPAFTGYVSYQFRDIESNLLPFQVGSYLGTKKVFNVGAGIYHQKNAMWETSLNAGDNTADTTFQNELLASVDVFLEQPLGSKKRSSLTLYASYNYLNMGTNFIRNVGINNPTNGTIASQASYNGSGNTVPLIGTGTVLFAQAGVVFPQMKQFGRIQPYASVIVGDYKRLSDKVIIPDFGLNWYLAGHSAKVTLNYRPRPVFNYADPAQKWSDIRFSGRKNEFTMQLQVYL